MMLKHPLKKIVPLLIATLFVSLLMQERVRHILIPIHLQTTITQTSLLITLSHIGQETWMLWSKNV